MCKSTLGHYALACLSLVALVVINIFGKESEAITTALIGVISASVWGGIQREQARRTIINERSPVE